MPLADSRRHDAVVSGPFAARDRIHIWVAPASVPVWRAQRASKATGTMPPRPLRSPTQLTVNAARLISSARDARRTGTEAGATRMRLADSRRHDAVVSGPFAARDRIYIWVAPASVPVWRAQRASKRRARCRRGHCTRRRS